MRDLALAAAGALAAVGAAPEDAAALPLRFVTALTRLAAHRPEEHSYSIPPADGAMIDKKESVIIVRWQGVVYAFSLACPHQNTALRWDEGAHQFQCPKHHSRYQPDGTFIEGRATRGMDRFTIRRVGDTVVVDLDKVLQQNTDLAAWTVATIAI